jgi:hypothetical protein
LAQRLLQCNKKEPLAPIQRALGALKKENGAPIGAAVLEALVQLRRQG